METKSKLIQGSYSRAILAGVGLDGQTESELRAELEELGLLARAAGVQVLDTICQRRERIDSGYCMGRGKVERLAARARELVARLIIFDNDLSPAQVRNLERLTDCRVIDRSEVILEIFARRARTRQARMQVELAQLEYLRPRLRRMWTHLERYEGGIGMRGPGEKQLELDRRLIDRRILDLRGALARVAQQRARERHGRQSAFRVALIGYTNAGKTTLLNRLTGAGAYAADELFATLDTRTRRWPLPSLREVVISDTIGFVRKLPHHLIASFHATLGEVIEADLLLHVVDASSARAVEQAAAVAQVIQQVGADSVSRVHLLNKVDLVTDALELTELRAALPGALEISARTGRGLAAVAQIVTAAADEGALECEVIIAVDHGQALAFVRDRAQVLARRAEGPRVRLRVRILETDLRRLESLGAVCGDEGDSRSGPGWE
ncbi:MAG: GTPase HflX [Planctomycetes bacterium]|nr:GTPase HflX [Planctomycetota bacterium]